MSRVKRRRLEALKNEAKAMAEEAADNPNASAAANKKAPVSVKALAKKAKNLKRQRDEEVGIGEKDVKKARISVDGRSSSSPKAKTKIVRQKFAAGGLDLDSLGWSSGSSSSASKANRGRGEEKFRGLDASQAMKKKTSKPSSNSFKSKKRFKRR
jgi:hypothetical protein